MLLSASAPASCGENGCPGHVCPHCWRQELGQQSETNSRKGTAPRCRSRPGPHPRVTQCAGLC